MAVTEGQCPSASARTNRGHIVGLAKGSLFSSVVRVELLQQPTDRISQLRKIALDRVPNDPEIDAEVAVRESVAHAHSAPPEDFRFIREHLLRKIADRLADDLELSDDCVVDESRLEELSRSA